VSGGCCLFLSISSYADFNFGAQLRFECHASQLSNLNPALPSHFLDFNGKRFIAQIFLHKYTHKTNGETVVSP
jgi:hypothetical protein